MGKHHVVVVTGAAAGIGLGIATRFAQDGHPLLMLDVQGEELEAAAAALQKEGANVLPRRVDITDRAQIDAAYNEARAQFGPISIVTSSRRSVRCASLSIGWVALL